MAYQQPKSPRNPLADEIADAMVDRYKQEYQAWWPLRMAILAIIVVFAVWLGFFH